MSLLKVVQLVCDGRACTNAYQPDYGDLDSAVEQRRKALKEGWKRSGGSDYCPMCVARMDQAGPEVA